MIIFVNFVVLIMQKKKRFKITTKKKLIKLLINLKLLRRKIQHFKTCNEFIK